jgi:YfiH family protein
VSAVEVIRAAALHPIPHGFFGRRGGVSEGHMSGLNVGYGSGDDPAAIAENRRRVVEAVLPGAELATVHQVHSPEVVYVERAWAQAERPRVDAMVSDRPGVLLGVLTADCGPVLLADVEARVVGAAHAGWRGALAGVTDATVAAMEGLGASRQRITAAVGPCIGQASYEVDQSFRDRFLEDDSSNARFFTDGRAGKPHFDLPAYIRHRLLASGIGEVEMLHLDTYADPERFYSYRRSTHRGEPSYGRQISVIGLAP